MTYLIADVLKFQQYLYVLLDPSAKGRPTTLPPRWPRSPALGLPPRAAGHGQGLVAEPGSCWAAGGGWHHTADAGVRLGQWKDGMLAEMVTNSDQLINHGDRS